MELSRFSLSLTDLDPACLEVVKKLMAHTVVLHRQLSDALQ